MPYREEREQAGECAFREPAEGESRRCGPAIHPGAGGEKPPGRAPYRAMEVGLAVGRVNRGGNAVNPSLDQGGFFYCKK